MTEELTPEEREELGRHMARLSDRELHSLLMRFFDSGGLGEGTRSHELLGRWLQALASDEPETLRNQGSPVFARWLLHTLRAEASEK